MANVLNASSTNNGGLIATGDDSGVLNIQTNETTAISIDASQSVDFTNNIDAPNTFGFKNRLINGGMVIDQRNAGASVTPADGAYTVDRWQYQASQASKFTVQQTPSATETGYATRVGAGFTSYLAATVASSVSVGSGDYFGVLQRIEGFNFADMAWGTANAKAVTLSFWAYSSLTGTFGGSLRNSAQNRSYPFTYSIPTANTWTQISVTIAGDTSGTWLITNGIGVQVWFALGTGSTYSGTSGSWAGANYLSATGAVSVVGTGSATFYITGVQLEKGTQATSFDFRSYGTELALCQRYYYVSSSANDGSGGGVQFVGNALSGALTIASGQGRFPVTMRTAPTVTLPSGCGQSGLVADSTSTASQIGTDAFVRVTIASGSWSNSYTPVQGRFIASAEL